MAKINSLPLQQFWLAEKEALNIGLDSWYLRLMPFPPIMCLKHKEEQAAHQVWCIVKIENGLQTRSGMNFQPQVKIH